MIQAGKTYIIKRARFPKRVLRFNQERITITSVQPDGSLTKSTESVSFEWFKENVIEEIEDETR